MRLEFALNSLFLRAFNAAYHRAGRAGTGRRMVPCQSFFYPLDATGDRNPVYRRRGMYQYQSVVLPTEAHAATEAMLRAIASAAHFRRRVGSRAMDAVPCA
jgi:hypothetical protein